MSWNCYLWILFSHLVHIFITCSVLAHVLYIYSLSHVQFLYTYVHMYVTAGPVWKTTCIVDTAFSAQNLSIYLSICHNTFYPWFLSGIWSKKHRRWCWSQIRSSSFGGKLRMPILNEKFDWPPEARQKSTNIATNTAQHQNAHNDISATEPHPQHNGMTLFLDGYATSTQSPTLHMQKGSWTLPNGHTRADTRVWMDYRVRVWQRSASLRPPHINRACKQLLQKALPRPCPNHTDWTQVHPRAKSSL